jgi:hypothetical protein
MKKERLIMTRDINIDNRSIVFSGRREWFEVYRFDDRSCMFDIECGDEYKQSITLSPAEATKLREWLVSEGY